MTRALTIPPNAYHAELIMLNKCFLLTLSLSLCLVAGCAPGEPARTEQTPPPTAGSPTPLLEATPTPGLSRPTATPSPTPQPTLQSLTATLAVSPTPSLVPTVAVQSKCSAAEPLRVEESLLLRGLVFGPHFWDENTRTWVEQTWILGQEGFRAPALILDDLEDLGLVDISPNRAWLAYIDFLAEDENSTIMKVKLLNPRTLEEKERVFESRAPLVSFGEWVNDATFLVATTAAGEMYEWILWEPFTDQEQTVTLELTGMGRALEIFHTVPVLDPTLSLVVYPCDRHQCGGAEYQVKSLTTGESLWAIDFQTSDPLRNRPIWSPDGRFLAVFVSEAFNLNHLLQIYDRAGTLVYNLALPKAGISLTWAPDSQRLAFFRTVPDPVEEVVRVLTYLELQDGGIYDLCLTDAAGAYPIVCSPDSTKLAINAQLEYAKNSPALLSIVDIDTGEIVQVYQTEWHRLKGWVKPIGE